MKCNQPQNHISLTLPPRRDSRNKPEKLSNYDSSSSVKEGPTLPLLSVPELNKETSGCPTLWGCSMVSIGKNIINCSKNPQFLPVMCALCPHYARCARAVFALSPRCVRANKKSYATYAKKKKQLTLISAITPRFPHQKMACCTLKLL